jgi:hypothetical protein
MTLSPMENIIRVLGMTLLLTGFVPEGLAQGNFAGNFQKLVGKAFKDKSELTDLQGYTFREGSLVSPVDDPESITVDVYQRGSNAIVFFSINENPDDSEYVIADVLEVKNVQPGWQIRTTFCRQSTIENPEIVALVKSSATEEFLTTVRQAWRFSRDKRRFELLNVKGIDCLSEGGG